MADENLEIIEAPGDLEIIAPPETEPESSPTKKANQFLYGVNERSFAPIEAVEDIIKGNVKVAGHKIPLPWGGDGEPGPVSRFLKETFYKDDAVTPGEKIARSAGSYVPDTLAMMAGNIGPMGVRGAEMAADFASPAVKQIIGRVMEGSRKGLIAKPATTGLAEVSAGAGAGAGGEVYRRSGADFGPGSELVAEGVGSMGPGLVPAAGRVATTLAKKVANSPLPIPTLIRKGAETAAANLPPEMLERYPGLKVMNDRRATRARAKAAEDLAKEYVSLGDPEMQAALAEAQRLSKAMPGFKPSLGESTGLTSALTSQADIERRASGADLDALAARQQGSQRAIGEFLDKAAPPTAGSETERLLAPSAAGKRIVDREKSIVDQEIARIGEEEASVLSSSLPETDRFKAGEMLQDRLQKLKGAESQRMSAMFDEIAPAEEQVVPFEKLQKRIEALKPSEFADTSDLGPTVQKIIGWGKAPDVPAVESSLLDEFGRPMVKQEAQPSKPPTFADVKFLRESLGDDMRKAQRAGDRQLARRLGQAIDEVDAFIDEDWVSKLPADLAKKYRDARKTYKTEYIDRFEKGATREAKRLGADNNLRTPNEDVAFEFWTPGGVTEARQYKTTFGEDPAAKKALYGVIIDDMRETVAPHGQWSDAKYRRWLTRNRDNLNEFPDLKEHVSSVGGAIEALSARRGEQMTRQRDIAETVLAKWTDNHPEKIADIALSDVKAARSLAAEMSPVEREMVGRLAWERVTDAGLSADGLRKILEDRRAALNVWLKPEQINALDDAAKALQMLERSAEVKGKPLGVDFAKKLKESIGSGPMQIASRVFAAESGRTSWRYVFTDLAMRAGLATNAKEAEKIARQAIYDPLFAKDLAKYAGEKFKKKDVAEPRALRAYIGAILARPTESEDRGDASEPLKIDIRPSDALRGAPAPEPEGGE